MGTESLSLQIIDRYIEQELLMASLYERFSEFYSDHREFWTSLVSEEHEHAAWIKHFHDGIAQDRIHFSEGKTRISAIQSLTSYIKDRITEFDRHPFNIKKAVSICLDLEKSLIERNVFKHFESDSPEVKKILAVLTEVQEKHVEKIINFSRHF